MAEFNQVSPDTATGLTVSGVLAHGPYVMNSKIWLPKTKLTRTFLGDLFCLDSNTILLRSRETNIVVLPERGDVFPIEQLDPKNEWQCDGEPKRRFGLRINKYASMKIASAGILAFALFISHMGLLVSLLVSGNNDISEGLWHFAIASMVVCIFLELLLALLLFLIGTVDVDADEGQETYVAMCHCFSKGLYRKTLRYWNNATTFAACFLSGVSLVSTITYVVYMVQNESQS